MAERRTMHRPRRGYRQVVVTLGVAMLVLIGLPGLSQPTAFAASLVSHAGSGVPGTLGMHVLPGQPSAHVAKSAASCVLSEWLMPESQTATLGHATSVTEHWGCGPVAFLLIVFDFGDGSNASYWCYLNCFSGSQTCTHMYARRGTYSVFDGTDGGSYPYGTIVVR